MTVNDGVGAPYPGQGEPPTRPAFGPFAAPSAVALEPAVWSVPATVQRLPTTPAAYHQLLRGPSWRWWRPLLSLPLLLAIFVAGLLVALAGTLAFGWLSGERDDPFADFETARVTPVVFLAVNLMLISLIPAVFVATRVAHGIRAGYVGSVSGRLRRDRLGRSLVIIAPVWILYLGISVGVSLLLGEPLGSRPAQWPALLVLTLLTTPFQAAAEEFLFRGWLTQQIGGYFASEKVGLVVATAVSATLFALAHGSLDPWIVADLMVFAVAASLLAWRTGGLEAGIALHVINNVFLGVLTIGIGGWDEAFVSEETTGSPVNVVISLVVHATVVALVWRRTSRAGLPSRFQPTPPDRMG